MPFRIPPGLRIVRVDHDSGLPSSGGNSIDEAFKPGTEPNEYGAQGPNTAGAGGYSSDAAWDPNAAGGGGGRRSAGPERDGRDVLTDVAPLDGNAVSSNNRLPSDERSRGTCSVAAPHDGPSTPAALRSGDESAMERTMRAEAQALVTEIEEFAGTPQEASLTTTVRSSVSTS